MSEGLALREFKAALFDVDGTLIDSLDALVQGLGDVLEKYAPIRPADHEIRAMVGLPLSAQLKRFGRGDVSAEELDEMTAFAVNRFHENRHLERPIAPALETLSLCKRAGLKTALVTSKNAEELRLFRLRFTHAEHVDAFVCASDVANPKPDAECVLLACEKLGVEAKEAVMIGDSVFDLQAARAAGAATVAVTYGSHGREELAAQSPGLLLETAEDLLRWAETTLLEPTCPERNR
jgi:HAD superfamily hydrolase (TIGR01509 family)